MPLVQYIGCDTYDTADLRRKPDARLLNEERLSVVRRTPGIELENLEGLAVDKGRICHTTCNRRVQPGASDSAVYDRLNYINYLGEPLRGKCMFRDIYTNADTAWNSDRLQG
jgi:hypothetical protein